jgi:hypothetical protein
MVPQPVPNEPGLVTVDATWGAISPMQIAPWVRTVGELEVTEHIDAGLPLVDTRPARFYREGTIPSAGNVPHEQIEESIISLDPELATIFFCNGPQCAATPAPPSARCSQAPIRPRRSSSTVGHPRLDDTGTAHRDTSGMNGQQSRPRATRDRQPLLALGYVVFRSN